ncbi:hypothetical protein [Streptomyces laurentii]|uniref:hypothetical protein n=1 Tax=Streptomyces laurentii TaxID=39478 RepID=UPI00340297B8
MTGEETPRDAVLRGLAHGRRLTDVVDVWSPEGWLEVDRRVRDAYRFGEPGLPRHDWLTATGPGTPEPADGRLLLALCTSDGRIREAALAHAAGRPVFLPLIALRTTDWAGPVRARARAVLAAELPGAEAGTLRLAVPVILRGRRRERGDAAFRMLEKTLATAPPEAIHALSGVRDRATRLFALDVALDRGLYTLEKLAEIAADDIHVEIRDRASAAVLAAGAPGESLGPLLASTCGRVRSAGVTALRKTGRAAEAEAFLFDRSGLVRACARWVLRQDGRDPVPLYRAACADPATVPDHAPFGLAECGDRATDLPALWALTAHERPRVRASAVAGLRRFDVADLARLFPLLDDPSPRVAWEATRTLRAWADRLPEAELLRRTGPGHPAHVRARALRLLGAADSAAYEETAGRLAEDPDPELRLRLRYLRARPRTSS